MYLFAGDDHAKIDTALSRLRVRAEREGGEGSLEHFGTEGTPDAHALAGAIPAMSLMATHRYLLADGVEAWSAAEVKILAAAIAAMPPDLTIVLAARESGPGQRPARKVAKQLVDAVRSAGGEVRRCDAPKTRDLPRKLMEDAAARGFRLDGAGAKLLVSRLGESTTRLANELDRLAVWAGEGGEVGVEDLEAMLADTTEEVAWALSDALVDRDRAAAMAAAERLLGQGEALTPLIYGAAKRLREARLAKSGLDDGRPAKEVEASLPMHPYAAKLLVGRLGRTDGTSLRAATCAMADLEWWTRGGSDYPDDVALTLAVRRASGGGKG